MRKMYRVPTVTVLGAAAFVTHGGEGGNRLEVDIFSTTASLLDL
jgi:hypothetical protein